MNHYSVIALDNFFKKNNLFLFDVEKVKIQKGSIIGYVCHNNFIKRKSQKLEDIIELEKKSKINKIQTVKKIEKVIKKKQI